MMDAIRHGTPNAYCYHNCRCVACREAQRVKMTDWRRRRGVRPTGRQPTVHGTMNAYARHKCRCVLCREANALAQRLYRAAKRARA